MTRDPAQRLINPNASMKVSALLAGRDMTLSVEELCVLERFAAKVLHVEPCWEWQGYLLEGYGSFWHAGNLHRAHRWLYERLVGPIPAGLTLDHLCRNRGCVRPTHLEPVTRGENVLRGEGSSAVAARATHCRKGHQLSGDNLVVSSGYRQCRICRNARQRARWAERKTSLFASEN